MLISHTPLLPSRVGVAAEIDMAAGEVALRLYWDAPGDSAAVDGAALSPALAGRPLLVSEPRFLSVSDLLALPEHADHGVIAVAEAPWSRRPPLRRPLTAAYQFYAATLQTRRPGRQHLLVESHNVVAALLVPWRDAAPSAMALHINHHPDCPLIIDRPVVEQGIAASFAAVMPRLSAPASGWVLPGGESSVDLTIASPSPIPAGAEVWLEATGGYLPLHRVPIAPAPGGGIATARLMALGLRRGESVRLKAGWRFWPSAAETLIEVL